VTYELIPGAKARFGEIEIAGAEKVTPAVVRRMLTFHTGDLYTREALLRSQRNLFGQELFRHAEIRAAPDPDTDTLIDVRVQVNEGDIHRVRAGVGLSTAEYINAEGRWISRSFLGGARRLEVRGSLSNLLANQLGQTPVFTTCDDLYCRMSGSIAADFAQPWFFGPLNTLGAGLYFERRTLPQVFVRTAGGGYFSFSRSLGIGESMSLAYRPELTKLETQGDLTFCSNFVACGPREIEALREANWLSPFTVSYVRDRSNSIFAPSRGNQFRFEGEYAGKATASDFAYTRLAFDVVDYSTLARGLILAARLRSGWAQALADADSALGVHPQKRFFLGGANSVRGFPQFELGPKLLTIDAANRLAVPDSAAGWAGCSPQSINDGTCDASPLAGAEPDFFQVKPVGGALMLEGNVELRFPVFRDNLRGAAFLDFGQVWVDQDAIDFGTLAWTPGLGVRYFSPIGPIRIDVGYNPVGAERVNVLTTEVEFCPEPAEGEDPQCVDIQPGEVYDHRRLRNKSTLRPLDPVSWNPRDSFLDRLQFHFSIGQAF
jgi:outer membrane protein insertion porin family/translocation and assembly module TamA